MKSVLFINQSPNSMLCDIADVYAASGYRCILLSGDPPAKKNSFSQHVLLKQYNRSSAISRLNSWMTFLFQSVKWIKRNNAEIDLYFLVSNPPFTLYLPLLTSIKKSRIRMLVYDLYPDIFAKMHRILTFMPFLAMTALNKKAFRHAENIYAPSRSLSKAIGKYTDESITTVYNWVDTSLFQQVQKSQNHFLIKHHLENKFVVLYSGNMGKTHDVETLLATAEELSDEKDIVFLFIGEGEGMKAVDERIKAGAINCKRFPFQNELFNHSIACGDLAWLSYKKGYEEYSIPSKLPFYLATGTPVLMVGDPGSELAMLLEENKIGFAERNNEAKAIASLILQLMNSDNTDMRNRCTEFTRDHFSKSNAEAFL